MKKLMSVLMLSVLLFASGSALAANYKEEVKQRIQPVGEVCQQGEECGSAAPAAAAASSEPRGGKEVFNSVCSACHSTGAAGAPKFGDAAAWAPRIDKGMETLFTHALNGFNAMPAKGGCGNCGDEEIKNAVKYMVENSQ
ncbi:cytochrome c5 family protein [Marinobacteraceae bacterium S3BR75-40.1]